MNILVLYANHRLTGPAESVMLGARALLERGDAVSFAVGGDPRSPAARVTWEAARGLGLEPLPGLSLTKHMTSLAENRKDADRLARHIDENRIDMVHSNLENDHIVATMALSRSRRKPPIVRFVHDTGRVRRDPKRMIFRVRTDALVAFTEEARERNRKVFGVPIDKAFRLDPLADVERFDLEKHIDSPRPGAFRGRFVVGIATRVQKRRGLPVLFRAVKMLEEKIPGILFAVMGRGTRLEEIMAEAGGIGVGGRVLSLGYQQGEDYVRTMRHFDVFCYNRWGSDGTVKAVREAMLLARPVVAPRAGIFPFYIGDDERGVLVSGDAASFGRAIRRLYEDRGFHRLASERARAFAVDHFHPRRFARKMAAIHGRLEGSLERKT